MTWTMDDLIAVLDEAYEGEEEKVEPANPLSSLPEGFALQVAEAVSRDRRTLAYASMADGHADSATMAAIAAARLAHVVGKPDSAKALAPDGFATKVRGNGRDEFRAELINAAAMLAIAVSAFDAEVEEQRASFEGLIAPVSGGEVGRWKHRVLVRLPDNVGLPDLVRWLGENVGRVGADYTLLHGKNTREFGIFLKDKRKADLVTLRWTDETPPEEPKADAPKSSD